MATSITVDIDILAPLVDADGQWDVRFSPGSTDISTDAPNDLVISALQIIKQHTFLNLKDKNGTVKYSMSMKPIPGQIGQVID